MLCITICPKHLSPITGNRRAGRDGLDSDCVLFYNRGDCARIRAMLEHDDDSGQHPGIALGKLRDMTAFCETAAAAGNSCSLILVRIIPLSSAGPATTAIIRQTDRRSAVAKLITGCVRQLPSRFGIEIIADVLRGSENVRIQKSRWTHFRCLAAEKNTAKPGPGHGLTISSCRDTLSGRRRLPGYRGWQEK